MAGQYSQLKLKDLPDKVLEHLIARELDIEDGDYRDWRGLAEKMDLRGTDVNLVRSRAKNMHHGSCTRAMFEVYGSFLDLSVSQFLEIMKEIECVCTYDKLLQYMEENYEQLMSPSRTPRTSLIRTSLPPIRNILQPKSEVHDYKKAESKRFTVNLPPPARTPSDDSLTDQPMVNGISNGIKYEVVMKSDPMLSVENETNDCSANSMAMEVGDEPAQVCNTMDFSSLPSSVVSEPAVPVEEGILRALIRCPSLNGQYLPYNGDICPSFIGQPMVNGCSGEGQGHLRSLTSSCQCQVGSWACHCSTGTHIQPAQSGRTPSGHQACTCLQSNLQARGSQRIPSTHASYSSPGGATALDRRSWPSTSKDSEPQRPAPIKSLSEPAIMYQELREGKKIIHLLVHYVRDKTIFKVVVHFVKCLNKNHFKVMADVKNPTLTSEQNLQKVKDSYMKSQSVIVCITKGYRTIVESEQGVPETDPVHAREIYQWMLKEYQEQNNNTTLRFIPVLFEGATDKDIPEWLLHAWCTTTRRQPYRWQTDWLHLFWFLLNPAQIMEHAVTNGNYPPGTWEAA